MSQYRSSIAPEVIACIAEGRDPTVHELSRVAERILGEVKGARSAFSWGEPDDESSARLVGYRLAQVALVGSSPAVRVYGEMFILQSPELETKKGAEIPLDEEACP